MRNNYREDGFVWFEDQISEMADLLITVQGIRCIYLKRRDRSWIERIGDDEVSCGRSAMDWTVIPRGLPV